MIRNLIYRNRNDNKINYFKTNYRMRWFSLLSNLIITGIESFYSVAQWKQLLSITDLFIVLFYKQMWNTSTESVNLILIYVNLI